MNNVYILQTFTVVPGAPRQPWEAEYPVTRFASEGPAKRFANWWRYDQGRKDTVIIESYEECPVINGQVHIPAYIH